MQKIKASSPIILLSLLIAAITSFWFPKNVSALSCGSLTTIEQLASESKYPTIAEVLVMNEVDVNQEFRVGDYSTNFTTMHYTIRVKRSWKTELPEYIVLNSSVAGSELTVGKTYLLPLKVDTDPRIPSKLPTYQRALCYQIPSQNRDKQNDFFNDTKEFLDKSYPFFIPQSSTEPAGFSALTETDKQVLALNIGLAAALVSLAVYKFRRRK